MFTSSDLKPSYRLTGGLRSHVFTSFITDIFKEIISRAAPCAFVRRERFDFRRGALNDQAFLPLVALGQLCYSNCLPGAEERDAQTLKIRTSNT